ncbi:efflux RND transporter periplasmic adaptor subunit [Paraliobacillus salinarum]|uniref:efflux RND transporter periplasmic adaptor subunit n=1 Tax=Paraliobacillus salinarum TaxID=1158996 RepID=UPI0015F74606|nr:efflux RND transporter periplasmic adaptor subunit [Paraliobacillus salinarum]
MKKITYLLISLLIFLVACSEDTSDQDQPKEAITTVETEAVKKGDLTIDKPFYGRTSPVQATPVMAPVVGKIDSLEVKNGDQVEEDDKLFTMIDAQSGRKITITAPADGQITQFTAMEGDMISTEEPVATVADLSELTIELTVTANNLNLFKEDDEATTTLSDEKEELTATVNHVGTLPDQTGLYPVKLTLNNQDNQSQAGTVAKVTIAEDVIKDAWIIPTSALVEEEDKTYVYIAKENTASKVEVDILDVQTDQTAVKGSLSTDDQIVTSGQLTLSDGAKIRNNNGEDNAS